MASRDDEEQGQGPYAGTAYGCGPWGGPAAQTPSGYSGPSGTGYAGYASARDRSIPALGDVQRQRPDWDDVDYQQWRNEQVRKLDTEYQTWRQARYRKFADEFDAWRASRQDGASGASRTDPVRAVDALSQPSSSPPS